MRKIVGRIRSGADRIDVFKELHEAWGNPIFALRPLSLMLLYKFALRSQDPLLEAGSGLSSILLGLAAEKIGTSVTVMESDPVMAKRVQAALDDAGIFTVVVNVCPTAADGFYDPPGLPQRAGLFLLDGPIDMSARAAGLKRLYHVVRYGRVFADDCNPYIDQIADALATSHRITTVPEGAGVALCVPRSNL